MELSLIRRTLLDLLGAARAASPSDLAAMDQADWERLDAMAAQHRVMPLLHVRNRDNPAIPPHIAQGWSAAHRHAAMTAMLRQADLRDCVALLEGQGFAPIALKGAWLATHAYPEPALRPLRDFDLLLPVETVIAAYHFLSEAGFTHHYEAELPLEDQLRLDHQMPPLISPRGTVIELHQRTWWPDGRMDHAMPGGIEDALRERAVRVDGVTYPCAEDLLAHLIVHGIYSHRLDCGPLVLTDIRYLVASERFDWPEFWRRARAEGWEAGARLLFELTRHFEGADAAPAPPGDGPRPTPTLLASAPDMLLQDLDTGWSAKLLSTVMTARPAMLLRRMAGRTSAHGEGSVQRHLEREGGFLRWAWSRLRQALAELSDPSVRRQSLGLARLSRWLDAGRR